MGCSAGFGGLCSCSKPTWDAQVAHLWACPASQSFSWPPGTLTHLEDQLWDPEKEVPKTLDNLAHSLFLIWGN